MSAMLLLGVGGTSTPNDALGFDDLVGWEGLRQVFGDSGAVLRKTFRYTADANLYVPQQTSPATDALRLKAVAVVARNANAAAVDFSNVTIRLIRRSGAEQRVGEIVVSSGDGLPRAFFLNGLSAGDDPFVQARVLFDDHGGHDGVVVDVAVLQVTG